jgi:phosphoribosylformylglycinamidine cyclo-ligase
MKKNERTGDKYADRGVSSSKPAVTKGIGNDDKGLYPSAFCKILPDVLAGSKQHCNIVHADGAGTKILLAYLYWRETGDISVFRGIIQDSWMMNLNDLLCVGVVDKMLISSSIDRNKHKLPDEVLFEFYAAARDLAVMLGTFGINIVNGGGETADVGNAVRVGVVNNTVTARMRRSDIINNANIRIGDAIVGISSSGQASYEGVYNGGMGSNGLTSSIHDIFAKVYMNKYPETFDPDTPPDLIYSGSKLVKSKLKGVSRNAGQLVLSPTRNYGPIMKKVFGQYRHDIHGMCFNSGGGQTKILGTLGAGKIAIKDNLMPIPPLFNLIRKESGSSMANMWKTFNMGHLMEVIVEPKLAPAVIEIAKSFDVEAQVVGHIKETDSDRAQVEIIDAGRRYLYYKDNEGEIICRKTSLTSHSH